MNVDVIGQLTQEDLERYREVSAYRKVMEMHPCGFSPQQCVNIFIDFDQVMQDIIERYEIEPGTFPMISTSSGTIAEKF